ncbi:MAG: guanylate kinase [Pseudanabaenaceae cyanobacterium bins.68]|nr:guanylate kinase [Pseudanabaenaceae cyanobacterium bins.68]
MAAKSGKLVVITGPSGVGKGTLIKAFLQSDRPEIVFSISATTRTPRPGEVEGREYYFLSRSQFEGKIRAGEFLEWAEYAGNFYGTLKQPVEQAIAQGKIVLLEIELAGARQVAQNYPQAQKIFIAPPSLEVLAQRLAQRGSETESAIAKRLEQAQVELAAQAEFDLVIINDRLETALTQLSQAIFPSASPQAQIALAAFIAIFIAELGDKTQLTTLTLAAESHNPLIVFLGVAIALVSTSLLGVVAGKWLGQKIPPQLLNSLAGVVFLLLSLKLLWEIVLAH